MTKIPLSHQADAVERAVVNLKGSIATLQDMARLKSTDPAMVKIREAYLVDLEAAYKTMRWIEANESKIKASLQTASTEQPT